MKASLKSKAFINSLKGKKEGDTVKVESGNLVVEHIFDVPTHFPFHQRIFPPGLILKKPDSNVRIYIEAEKVGISPKETDMGKFVDKQIGTDGKPKPADRGLERNKVNEKLLKKKK